MKYDEIMEKIEVTPGMRQRILQNLETAQPKRRPALRQLFTLAACLAIVLCCWFAWKPRQAPPEQGMMAVSQIDSLGSLQALSEKTGIPLTELTGLPFAVEHTEYVSYWEELAEIQYFGATDSLRYRKSLGTEDNSGDYNTYPQTETLEIFGNSVTLKGENGAFTLALWTDGSYTYSISVTQPLSKEAFQTLISENF